MCHVPTSPIVFLATPPRTVLTVFRGTIKMGLVGALNALKTVPIALTPLTALSATMDSTCLLLVYVPLALSKAVSPVTAPTTVSTVSSPCGKTPAPAPSAPHPAFNALPLPLHAKAVSSVTTFPAPIATRVQVS